MATLNRVFLIGNLTKEVTLNGEVANTSLAINEKYKDKEKVHYIDIVAFGKTASLLNTYCTKGSSILIDGKLDYQAWTTKDGTKKNSVKVIANNIQFLSTNKKQEEEF